MNLNVTRTIDDLGRLNLPTELRKMQDWGIGDEINLSCQDDTIVLKLSKRREEPICCICKTPQRKLRINGLDFCDNCASEAC